MKSKFLLIFFLVIFFYQNLVRAEIFNIESSEIKILDKGNITKATNGVKIISNDGVEISGKELIYNNKIDSYHYKLTGFESSGEKIDIDIWYDDKKNWVKMIFLKDGSKIEYFLDEYDTN